MSKQKLAVQTDKADDHSKPLACEQALHLGESREVTREQHAKGDSSAWGVLSCSLVACFALHA